MEITESTIYWITAWAITECEDSRIYLRETQTGVEGFQYADVSVERW